MERNLQSVRPSAWRNIILVFLTITCAVFFLLAITFAYYAYRFGRTILSVQDSLEEALDVIDEKYDNISSICERPLFYDSREVRDVLKDIKDTREALHDVAYALTSNFNPEENVNEGQKED